MATIVTRSGKGSALTHTEMDANFNNLNAGLGSDVVDDLTPQLGGNLDLNGKNITGTGAIPSANLSGALPTISGAALTGISSITKGTAVSPGGTSYDFTSIPAGTKKITVMTRGLSSNSTYSWKFQLGTSGGIITTGYQGSYGHSGAPGILLTTGFGVYSDTAADVVEGSIVFNLLDATNNTWVATGNFAWSSRSYRLDSRGSVILTNPLTTIRLTTLSGSAAIDAGKLNISYEA